MDWLLATPQIQSAFSSLGSFEGDIYVVSPNALAVLEEINYKLTYEDQTLRTFRRAIGFCQNVRTDLIPLLVNAKDDTILESVIRILVNLTVPVECLFSVDVMYRTEVGRHTIFELNKLLYTSKEAFTDPKSTKSIVEFMKHILESDTKLTPEKCEQINNCLLLLRNILHIPETNANFIVPEAANPTNNGGHNSSMQNSILWNLFIQSIDKLLLYLMTCPQRACWGVTIVQLIALMYKDQHVGTLQKLLNLWFEASLSESSEDNESNTSPPKQASGDSSPMLTSDPTSDSSDTGSGTSNNKNENSEERRQNMREDTEATLQEVSRKGQAYQNSMLRMHLEEPEDIVENVQTNESDFAVEIEETSELFESTVDKQTDTVKAVELSHKQESTVENLNEQTIAKETDDVHFKPPIAVPAKSHRDAAAADATQKAGQKSTNSGQNPKNICYPQKRECPSSQSELSDCGYGTQVENQDFVSTSSNEDDGPQGKPQHQKPPCNSKTRIKQRTVMSTSDTKELRRKKLVKRSKSSLINMKGLVQHTPTDEDISNLLKEFTVDFLLKGYGHLVQEIHLQLLTNIKIPIDTSHFFWLVTYFLKFAAQLELDMEHINTILTFDVISYLTYEGVMLCEQLELNARQEGSDLKPYLRRMHLVVTAIREFLQAIETFKKISHLSEEDRDHLKLLQIKIGATEDLRLLFLLLLRRFNPGLHTKQYLQDLIVTNHTLLLILDSVSNSQSDFSIDMVEHISQFATIEVMYYYGLLLEDFKNNGQFVNDCIFTMMHHICGDLSQVATLFQPVILKTYSRIWETDYELCDDWSDLIEYVIHKFINTPQKSPLALPATSLTEMTKEHNLENSICSWTQEEMDTLYWYYIQSKKNNDVVGKIVRLFSNNVNKQKSRISIIQQLLQQDIITLVEYDDLMKFEDAEYQRALLTTPTESTTESGIELKDSIQSGKPSDDIQTLRDLIIKEKKTKHLVWLQKLLLECCYIKYLQNEKELYEHKNDIYVMESVAYHCILKNKSIPVVQWNSEQASFMLYQPFVLLLHKLGFQLPVDAGSIYARIPEYWSASIMFNLAKKLGPFDKLPLKFEAAKLEEKFSVGSVQVFNCQQTTTSNTDVSSNSSLEVDSGHLEDSSSMKTCSTGILATIPEVETGNTVFAVPKSKPANSGLRFATVPTPVPSVPNWLQVVMRSKCNLPATSIGNEQKNIDALSTLLTTKSTTALITSTTACLKTTISTTKATTMTNAAAPMLCQSISNLIETNVFTSNVTATANCGNNQAVPSYVNEQDKQQQQLNQQEQQQQQQQINLDDDAAMRSIERTDNTRTGTTTLESEYSAMVASVYEQEFANSDTASVASDLTRMYVSDEDEKHDY